MDRFIDYYKNLTEHLRTLTEALTIPENPSDETEVELRKKLSPRYEHSDRIIRWYRNAVKSGEDPKDVEAEFVRNLRNIQDLLKTYDTYVADLRRMKLAGRKLSLDVQGGKTIEVDPVKDIDKIRKLRGFQAVVQKLGDLVHNDVSIDSENEKYQITDEDRKNICLLGASEHVMLWRTAQYESTNKFIYQLWQNANTLGRGGVYGNPSEQTPYCTASKEHWNDYSEDFGDRYRQFWFLKRLPEFSCGKGDLTDSSVVKVFNQMKGLGSELIIAMNDSGNDMLDRRDNSVEGWNEALMSGNASDICDQLKYAKEVLDLQNNLAPVTLAGTAKYPWENGVVEVGGNGAPPDQISSLFLNTPEETYTGTKFILDRKKAEEYNMSWLTFSRLIGQMQYPANVKVSDEFTIDGKHINLQHPPKKIRSSTVNICGIDSIAEPIEIDTKELFLQAIGKDALINLRPINSKESTLRDVELLDMSLDSLKFLPDNLGKLKLENVDISTFEKAPFDVSQFSFEHEEEPINQKEYYYVMQLKKSIKAVRRYYTDFNVLDSSFCDKWKKNNRFHSLIFGEEKISKNIVFRAIDLASRVVKDQDMIYGKPLEQCYDYYYNGSNSYRYQDVPKDEVLKFMKS